MNCVSRDHVRVFEMCFKLYLKSYKRRREAAAVQGASSSGPTKLTQVTPFQYQNVSRVRSFVKNVKLTHKSIPKLTKPSALGMADPTMDQLTGGTRCLGGPVDWGDQMIADIIP